MGSSRECSRVRAAMAAGGLLLAGLGGMVAGAVLAWRERQDFGDEQTAVALGLVFVGAGLLTGACLIAEALCRQPPKRPKTTDAESWSAAGGLTLAALVLLGGSLALLIAGSTSAVAARRFDPADATKLILGLALLTLAVLLLLTAVRSQRPRGPTPPTAGTVILVALVALFVGLSCLTLVDAFTNREGGPLVACRIDDDQTAQPPQSGPTGPSPPSAGRPRPRATTSTFVLPEESDEALGLTVQLGRTRPATDRARQRLVLEADSPRARVGPVPVYLSDLRRDDGTRLNRNLVKATGQIIDRGRTLVVGLCVQPLSDQYAEMHAGRYRGTISVNGARVTPIDLPVAVELQFNRWPVLVTLLIGTLIVATFVLFNGVKQLGGRTASLRPSTVREFGNWIISNPVAIGTGVVAAVAVFTNQYLADPVWSGRTGEVFALIGATAASFLGAATVAAGVGPKRAGEIKQAEEAERTSPADLADVGPRGETAARWAVDIGGITAVGDRFKPEQPATLTEVAQTLYQAWGAPEIPSAPDHGLSGATETADPALRWILEDRKIPGVVAGVGSATRPVTRNRLAQLLYHLAGDPAVRSGNVGISDLTEGSKSAVRWVVANGIMTGYPDGTFRGAEEVTRLQLARAARHAHLLYGPEVVVADGA